MHDNVEQASRMAARYGVGKLEDSLPRIKRPEPGGAAEVAGTEGEGAADPSAAGAQAGAATATHQAGDTPSRAPDPGVQLRVLTELAAGLESGRSLNELIQLVLEGIHDGIGFDRTYFALLTPDRAHLKPKYSLGANPDGFARCQREMLGDADPVFGPLFTTPGAQVLTGAEAERGDPWVADRDFVATAVTIGNSPVGVLYADRVASAGPIDAVAVDAFRHFAQQTVLVLSRSLKS